MQNSTTLIFTCLLMVGIVEGLYEHCDPTYRIERPGSHLCRLTLGPESDEFFFDDARRRISNEDFWTTALEVMDQCPDQSVELVRGLKYIWRGNTPKWVEMYANGDSGVVPLLLHLWQSWRRNRDIDAIFAECPVLIGSKIHQDILNH